MKSSSNIARVAAAGLAASAVIILAYYRRHRQQKKDEEEHQQQSILLDDPDIIVEELLDFEVSLHNRNQKAISTLTWFRGDYQAAHLFLEQRLQTILDRNPWLGGRVVKIRHKKGSNKKRPSLVYGKKNHSVHNFLFVHNDTAVARTTPLEELAPALCHCALLKNGPTQPLLQVSLIPCRDHPTQHFALVLAISHLVADGHTFYRIYSMLCSSRSSNMESLVCQRIATTAAQQAQAMGPENYHYVAKPNLGYFAIRLYGYLRAKTTMGRRRNSCRGVFVRVNAERVESEKKRHAAAAAAAANGTPPPFVSTNDILTSWFFQNCHCTLGVMFFNWRNRLPGHTDRHAGNYESAIVYRIPAGDAATPRLVRQSLRAFRRTVSQSQALPTTVEFLTNRHTAIATATNWASLMMTTTAADDDDKSIPHCTEELHLPLLHDAAPRPTTVCLMVIFRAGPQDLGLYLVGTPERLERLLATAPLVSPEPLV